MGVGECWLADKYGRVVFHINGRPFIFRDAIRSLEKIPVSQKNGQHFWFSAFNINLDASWICVKAKKKRFSTLNFNNKFSWFMKRVKNIILFKYFLFHCKIFVGMFLNESMFSAHFKHDLSGFNFFDDYAQNSKCLFRMSVDKLKKTLTIFWTFVFVVDMEL